MCAILDANVVHMVFGSSSSTEGKRFLKWLDSRKGRLVIGGKAKDELYQNGDFEQWARDESRAGRLVAYDRESKRMRFASVVEYDDTEIEAETLKIEEQKLPFESNDLHIIALARVSGARLLYSRDGKLQKDFKNEHLVHSPRGKVYSKEAHQHLLDQNLCRQ
ncbi:MAG: type II toxin-antitoxin system VapC family toxin [Nitrospira sp.]|nr:type II toxin-antitoxin system VapC family toxin [Nitrospira sp.]